MRTANTLAAALFAAFASPSCAPSVGSSPGQDAAGDGAENVLTDASSDGTSDTTDEDAGSPPPPLESAAPPIVPYYNRSDVASGPILYDQLRGGVWVANGDVGTVSLVDVTVQKVVFELPVGTDVRSVALSADHLWVAAVDRGGGAVALIDPVNGVVRRVIHVGSHPRAAVWDAANPRWLYVSLEDTGSVALIDRTMGVLSATFGVGRLPAGLAVSSQRRELYVTHRIDGAVTVMPLAAVPDSNAANGSGCDDAGDDASAACGDGGSTVSPWGPPYDGGAPLLDGSTISAEVPLAYEVGGDAGTTPHGTPFAFESLAWAPDGVTAWLPHELLANTHPIEFHSTLFPTVSVVDLNAKAEVVTNPNDPNGVIAGRKNLFDAIKLVDETGNITIMSQPCAAAFHPNNLTAFVLMCSSEDLLKFDTNQGVAVEILRHIPGDHPVGLALDPLGNYAYVVSDQTHSLATIDLGGGSPIGHMTVLAGPLPTVASDPIDPTTRAGLTLFYRGNSSKGSLATSGNNWMACASCHLDGFVSTNEAFFDVLFPLDPTQDARIGHTGLTDLFSTLPLPNTADDPPMNPHDVLTAFEEMGGLAPDRTGKDRTGAVDPSNPTPDALAMATPFRPVVSRDLPFGPSWLLPGTPAPNGTYDTSWCGQCHAVEYQAWQKSAHAHAGVDPMTLFCTRDEQARGGVQYSRLCAGCHDPTSARGGDTSLTSGNGVTCLSCHDTERLIRAGGNADIEYVAHDWTQAHQARASAALTTLRDPEFCGVCHQQFIPGTGMNGINTLVEWQESPMSNILPDGGVAPSPTLCVDCHAPKSSSGTADHSMLGGNVYLAEDVVGDPAMAQAEQQRISSAIGLSAVFFGQGAAVTVSNTGVGHSFPTGVTDIREPWVELQAVAEDGGIVAHYGGPGPDGTIPLDAARLGMDIATEDGGILYLHQLAAATRVPFLNVIPAGGTAEFMLSWPGKLPDGATELDAVLYYRNVRTQYFQAATGDAGAHAPDVEIARTVVQ